MVVFIGTQMNTLYSRILVQKLTLEYTLHKKLKFSIKIIFFTIYLKLNFFFLSIFRSFFIISLHFLKSQIYVLNDTTLRRKSGFMFSYAT